MATREEIIIDIQITEVADKLAATSAEIIRLKKENKELDKTTREGAEAFAKNAAAIKDLTVQEKVLSAQITATTKSTVTQSDSMKEQERELDKLKFQYASLTSEMKNSSGGKAMKKSIDDLDASVKANRASIGDHQRSVGNYKSATDELMNSSKGLRQQLKDIVLEMGRMAMAGEDSSQAFKELSIRGGEIKDTLADINQRLTVVGSDTRQIDQLVGAFTAMGSVVQIAEGSMQLFGSESEDVQRGIQKMVAIQGILNGVQEIGNALQKESAFMIGLAAAKSKILAVATTVNTNLTRIFGITSTAAWAAATLGVSLLITGITLLITNFNSIIGSVKSFFGITDKFKDVKTDIEAASKALENFGQSSKLTEDRLKAEGKTEKQILQYKKDRYNKQLNLERKLYVSLRKLGDKATDEQKDRLKESAAFIKADAATRFAFRTEEIELERKSSEEKLSMQKEASDRILSEEQKKKENSLKIAQELEDAIIGIIKEGVEKEIAEKRKAKDRKISELKKETKLTEQGLKDRDLLIKKLNEEFEKEASAMREKASSERLKAEAEIELKRLNILISGATEGTEKEYNLRLQALQKQRDMELAEVGLSEEEKKAIRDKFAKQEVALENEKVKEKLEISKKALKDDFELKKAKVLEDDVELANVKIMQLEAEHAALLSLDEKQKQALGLNQKQYETLILQSEAAIRAAKDATIEKENQKSVQQIQSFASISDSFGSILNTMAQDQEEMQDYLGAIALANIATSTASAIAGVVAAASKSNNVWQIIAEIAAGIASVTSTIITAKNAMAEGKTPKAPRFESGGIVPGTSYTGDNVPALVNSGEMILNTQQQTNLFKALNNTPTSNGFDYNQLAKAMENVRPQVAVTEIKNVNSRVDVIEKFKYI